MRHPMERLNTIEAAKFLGLAPHTLEQWRSDGTHTEKLPFVKQRGRRYRITYDKGVLIEFKKWYFVEG